MAETWTHGALRETVLRVAGGLAGGHLDLSQAGVRRVAQFFAGAFLSQGVSEGVASLHHHLQRRVVGLAHQVPHLLVGIDVTAPGQPFVANAQAALAGVLAQQLAKVGDTVNVGSAIARTHTRWAATCSAPGRKWTSPSG